MLVRRWDESPTPPAGSPSVHTKPALIIRIVSMEVMRRMNAFVTVVNFVTGKTPAKTTQEEAIGVMGKEGWSPSPWLLLGHPWSQ